MAFIKADVTPTGTLPPTTQSAADTFRESVGLGRTPSGNSVPASPFSVGNYDPTTLNFGEARQVYMGTAYNGSSLESKYQSVAEALNAYYAMSEQEKAALGKALYNYGLISDPNDRKAAFAKWADAVDYAASLYNAKVDGYGNPNGQKVTPWDAMGLMVGLDPNGPNGTKSNLPKTTTQTSTTPQHITKGDAKLLVNSIFKENLGRAATPAEIARYTSEFTAAARRNPVVTTSTQTVDANGNSTVSSNTTGGVNFQSIGTDKAKADPEYGAYQAATTYMNALLGAIGGV